MFKRTSIFALTAVAALGMTALATLSASARAGGPVGMHGPMGVSVNKPHLPMGVSLKPNKPVVTGLIINKKPPVITGIIIHKPWPPHHNWCKWHYCGPNWVIGGGVGVVSTGVIASTPVAAAAPAPGPCTCLTKTYLQDGSVLFKDVCTTESAIAPADQKAAN
jgi:hypothetical protein